MKRFWKFAYVLTLPIMFGYVVYLATSNPDPLGIGLLAGYGLVIVRWSILEVKDALPKVAWPPIYITREQLEDHPDTVAEHLRIITAIRADIKDREDTARAQFAMADRIDSGDQEDSAKAPAEGYRMAARTNQRSANYLRRTLNPIREDN